VTQPIKIIPVCGQRHGQEYRAHYDQLRDRGTPHHAALRQLANRLVGILHGSLKTGTTYNETTAWNHHTPPLAA